MKKLEAFVLSILLMVYTAGSPLLVSCSGDDTDAPQIEDNRANLILHASILGQSRATSTTDIEQLNTLRVVILRPDGKIEHNELFTNLEGVEFIHQFKLIPNEEKTLYLIANEYDENTADLNSFTSSTEGFQEAAANLTYTFDANKHIPMTGVYKIAGIEKGESSTQHLFVVRGVTKFDFSFENERNKSITIESVQLSALAPKSYLLPHFTNNGAKVRRKVDGTFEALNSYLLGETVYPSWEYWMKAIVDGQDEGSERTDAPFTDKDGWIMDYDVPEEPVHASASILPAESSLTIPAGESKQLAYTHYFPESTQLMDEEYADVPGMEQAYYITLEAKDADGEREFTEQIPNLRALFRNTHVKVEITFQDGVDPLLLKVNVAPWIAGGKVHIQMEETTE